MIAFEDTFKVMKSVKEHFGVPEYVENSIDNVVFFKRDRTECLLLVLQKSKGNLVFGGCRVVYGFKQNFGKWLFKVGSDISFDNDYFELFKENSFTNISMLARYFVLMIGNTGTGCEIDEKYWFDSNREF